MTLEEMIVLYRVQAADKAEPYLCDDEVLTIYANEAQDEACRRGDLLRDSASAFCQPAIAAGDEAITLDARIVRVLRAKINGRDVAVISSEVMDAISPNWQDGGATGTPTHLIMGASTGKLHLWPTPDAPCVARLTVSRLPLKQLASDADKPEVRPDTHKALVDWMLYRAFSQHDGDLYDEGKARAALSRFEAEFGERASARNEAWQRNGIPMSYPIA